MQSLKNEQRQIPGGYFFRQPEIKWDSKKVIGLHPSLDALTRAVISARKANPHYVTQHKWSLDFATVKEEVKVFNVKVCLSMGWTSYLTDSGGGAPLPLSQPQSQNDLRLLSVAAGKARKLWAGIKTLNEWLDSGEPPVEFALAESRAATCVACKLNGHGDFTTWFTTPAAAAIRRQLERLEQRSISTSQDGKLNVCTACLCPLKLKVQTPLKFIKPHLAGDVLNELKAGNADCWIVRELAQ